jgi:hypothetical protein
MGSASECYGIAGSRGPGGPPGPPELASLAQACHHPGLGYCPGCSLCSTWAPSEHATHRSCDEGK